MTFFLIAWLSRTYETNRRNTASRLPLRSPATRLAANICGYREPSCRKASDSAEPDLIRSRTAARDRLKRGSLWRSTMRSIDCVSGRPALRSAASS